MPHCQTLPLFPQFFFRRPSFKLDALKAPWADADADADAETETQNRHLQHGITYKFRMHDFALFWYLSNTCALNEVGVAVEVWVAVGVAVWCLRVFSFEFGDGDAQQKEICVWVRWGYVAIEWSRWTCKAWKKSTTATTSSRPLQSIFKSPARIDNVSPAVAQRVCGPEKLTDRHRDSQRVRGEGWQSQAATPVEDAFNASVTLQQLHRYLRLAVSIKNSSKYCQNKYDVINEQPVAFRHWLKLFIHCLPARVPQCCQCCQSCQSCQSCPMTFLVPSKMWVVFFVCHANSFATSRATLKHFGGCQKTSRETLLSQMHSISVIIKHPLAAEIT